MQNQNTPTAPEGFKINAKGDAIRVENIKEIDSARDEIVTELMAEAKDLARRVAAFKKKTNDTVEAFVELSFEKYNAKRGGKKGNVTLTAFDGSSQIVRRMADRITFDERLKAAESLIEECFDEWTEGAKDELRTVFRNAFKTDKQGNLSVGKILALRAVKIDHPKWKAAMEAISDAITIIGAKPYVCFYERNESGEYVQISLDPNEL
jgi:hypothetical protein